MGKNGQGYKDKNGSFMCLLVSARGKTQEDVMRFLKSAEAEACSHGGRVDWAKRNKPVAVEGWYFASLWIPKRAYGRIVGELKKVLRSGGKVKARTHEVTGRSGTVSRPLELN